MFDFIWTYKPYTLEGPPVIKPVPDSLAVLSLDNRLYMSPDSHMKKSQKSKLMSPYSINAKIERVEC